jgi:hypothetical protein
MPYFAVDDVDRMFQAAIGLGAREMVAPHDYPGGRFAIVADPEGASFGLLRPVAGLGPLRRLAASFDPPVRR